MNPAIHGLSISTNSASTSIAPVLSSGAMSTAGPSSFAPPLAPVEVSSPALGTALVATSAEVQPSASGSLAHSPTQQLHQQHVHIPASPDGGRQDTMTDIFSGTKFHPVEINDDNMRTIGLMVPVQLPLRPENIAPSIVGSTATGKPPSPDGPQRHRSSTDALLDQFCASDIIANEFRAMTWKERERVYQDFYGTGEQCDETSVFLDAKLDDLDLELLLIDDKAAYETASRQHPSYINSRDLRLQFLRAASYNSYDAAHRLVAWCQSKLELFGAAVLGRNVRMSDLSPDARGLLESGAFQVLPRADYAGRRIMCTTGFSFDTFSTLAIAEVFHYISGVLADDVETQKNGIVAIHALDCLEGSMTTKQRRNMYIGAQTTKMVPIKIQAMHLFAYDTPSVRRITNLLQLSLAKHVRHRFRAYFSDMESNLRAVSACGIPVDVLPFNATGNVNVAEHKKWFTARVSLENALREGEERALEEQMTDSPTSSFATSLFDSATLDTHIAWPTFDEVPCQDAETCADVATEKKPVATTETAARTTTGGNSERASISPSPSVELVESNVEDKPSCTPTEFDILMGRGRPYQEHSGNQFMKAVIADMYLEYDRAPRWGKLGVAEKVVSLMHGRRARFLKKCKERGCWIEATANEAREKVAHGFRKKREMDLAKARKSGRASVPRGTAADTAADTLQAFATGQRKKRTLSTQTRALKRYRTSSKAGDR